MLPSEPRSPPSGSRRASNPLARCKCKRHALRCQEIFNSAQKKVSGTIINRLCPQVVGTGRTLASQFDQTGSRSHSSGLEWSPPRPDERPRLLHTIGSRWRGLRRFWGRTPSACGAQLKLQSQAAAVQAGQPPARLPRARRLAQYAGHSTIANDSYSHLPRNPFLARRSRSHQATPARGF